MMQIITWSMANKLRERGLILNPEWNYEDEELKQTVKKHHDSFVAHCEADYLIAEKAQQQEK